jgi:hypothetical protein
MDFKEALDLIKSRDPNKIISKKEYYALYEKGYFGNMPKIWSSYYELIKDNWKGLVCIRSNLSSFKTIYNVSIKDIPEIIKKLEQKGIPLETLNFNQSLPDNHLIIQGEIQRSPEITLYYSRIQKPMKEAFRQYFERKEELNNLKIPSKQKLKKLDQLKKETGTVKGLRAKLILQGAMKSSSYDDLQILLETFPDSIIEFSTWECDVGNIKGRNTIFWEVRNY